jgi:hypothetical protein
VTLVEPEEGEGGGGEEGEKGEKGVCVLGMAGGLVKVWFGCDGVAVELDGGTPNRLAESTLFVLDSFVADESTGSRGNGDGVGTTTTAAVVTLVVSSLFSLTGMSAFFVLFAFLVSLAGISAVVDESVAETSFWIFPLFFWLLLLLLSSFFLDKDANDV